MMRKGICCLAGVLMLAVLGCQPPSSPAPSTNKPTNPKPDKKPSGPPKADPG